ncbi:hypothetical protein AN191_16785 [Loktanella sp. 5RATIMAR09]|nr:hypothetical protein AN191_16785 [Loktanella sp. 5RATIMAR09]
MRVRKAAMEAVDHFMIAAVLLLLTLALALFRAWFGPRAVDHVMAAQLVATSGVGVALTLGAAKGDASMLDAALVATVLASVAILAFVRNGRSDGEGPKDKEP